MVVQIIQCRVPAWEPLLLEIYTLKSLAPDIVTKVRENRSFRIVSFGNKKVDTHNTTLIAHNFLDQWFRLHPVASTHCSSDVQTALDEVMG